MPSRILLNGSFAPSVVNFRGPLIEDLVAAGTQVHVSVPEVTPAIRSAVEAIGARLHEVPLQRAGTSLRSDLAYYRHLRGLIRDISPDLVVGYTIMPNIWGSLAAAADGVGSASVVTGLGSTFLQRDTLKQPLTSRVSRLIYRRASPANRVIVFQNPADRDDFVAAVCIADA